MRVKQYLRNQLPVIFIHVLGMLALALFLLANGNAVQTVLFILMVWLLVLLSYLAIVCCMQKTRLNKLLDMAEQLEERYLIPEIMAVPRKLPSRSSTRL